MLNFTFQINLGASDLTIAASGFEYILRLNIF